MGLDMYLYAEKYHSGGWPWAREGKPEVAAAFDATLTAAGFEAGDLAEGSPSFRTVLTVAYWRKANQIHAWFVENIQGGVDECQRAYVERDKLIELKALCQEALDRFHAGQVIRPDDADQAGTAAELLPTRAGFFFGGTDYDEWYAADLKGTVEQLTSVLENPRLDGCDLYYQSSW